jgi:adenosylcobinamide-GDP ribazoletransferase
MERSGVRREVDLLLNAIQLLTRCPTPRVAELAPDWMARSAKYFPLVGQGVGLVCAGVWFVASRVWGGSVAALLAIAAGAALTGAFHEDGLADAADGLFGGRTRDQRLAIMKDSRIGVFALLAVSVCLAARVLALASLPWAQGVWALIGAHGGGRLAAIVVMARQPYAGDPLAAKLTPGPGRVQGAELAFAGLTCLWPLFVLGVAPSLAGCVLGAVTATWLALTAQRQIGGYTGDILGAAEQLFETAFLLGVAALAGQGR